MSVVSLNEWIRVLLRLMFNVGGCIASYLSMDLLVLLWSITGLYTV